MTQKRESVRLNAKHPTTGRDDSITVDISGREGSKTIFRKRLSKHHNVTNAEIEKMRGIARRLPAEAFDALFEDDTIELVLNPDGRVWQEKLGEPMVHICWMNESEALGFITQIAGYLRKVVNEESPTLTGVLPLDDSRIECVIPPATPHPLFSIRKRAVRIFTLDEYVQSGVMTPMQCSLIRDSVRAKKNIIVLGGTGSGKTTFSNAVLHEITVISPDARIVIIEDTAELNCAAENKVYLTTTPHVSMTDLIKTTLRLRPDRVVVGEVRGHEAFDLLQIWNTGHPGGIATLHANDCVSGLRRLKSLVSQHPYAPRDIEPDIALAVSVMVCIGKTGRERRIQEIVELREYDPKIQDNGGYRLVRL